MSLIALMCAMCVVSQNAHALNTNEVEAREWLSSTLDTFATLKTVYVESYWNSFTNLTAYNQQIQVEATLKLAEFENEAGTNASLFNWTNFGDEDLKRQFSKIATIGIAILPADKLEKRENLAANLILEYSTGKVCNKPGDDDANACYPFGPDLSNIMATSRDWEELEWAWKGWRDATGKRMKEDYRDFMALNNEAATMEGFEDGGTVWRSLYDVDDFEEQIASLWEQVKPIYQQLHAYVRRKLKEKYSNDEDKFPSSGHIPAHLLGDMWAQTWAGLNNMLLPYPNKSSLDVTPQLVDQGYNATAMFQIAEEFFTSLGLYELPQEFWDHSMLVKPEDRDVTCAPSAWDFYNGTDVRIASCTETNMQYLGIAHHELGHIQYMLQYKDLPFVYKDGANPGFHEAVGDTIALSSLTPEHLREIGLIDEIDDGNEFDLNSLMLTALEKIAFLPFGYLLDQWRWSVFNGETSIDEYTGKWWELRCLHQGISPPVTRSEDDFDPGAKFHIPKHVPYVRYFVSYIAQFQFHKALCEAANNTRPLHRCDIYWSKEAGTLLSNMLKLGSSKPWPDAMEAITGQREMDASALIEYFKPLTDWLEIQNAGHKITWEDECPPGSYEPPMSTTDAAPTETPKPTADAPSCLSTRIVFVVVICALWSRIAVLSLI